MDTIPIDLTEQERTIVELLARGHTINGVAATIELPCRTVEREILICRQKLGAKNNSELVAKAISSGVFR